MQLATFTCDGRHTRLVSSYFTERARTESTTAQREAEREQARFRAMDRDADGVITRSEWRGDAESFARYDTNHDGVLSGSEVWIGGRRTDVPWRVPARPMAVSARTNSSMPSTGRIAIMTDGSRGMSGPATPRPSTASIATAMATSASRSFSEPTMSLVSAHQPQTMRGGIRQDTEPAMIAD